jgi:tetratricopeptide (TPR) repeat protein
MRKSVLVLIFVSLVSSVSAQKKKKNEKPEPAKQEAVAQPQPVKTEAAKKDSVPYINPLLRHYAIKYQIALQWNDADVAKDALYDLIIESQANDSLIYELAYFYFQNQKYPSSVLVSQELLKRNPKNAAVLEMTALCYENIGVPDRALQSYESLYLLQNNPTFLYKMAFLQMSLKRFKESGTSADILLADKNVDALKVSYTGADKKAKEFPMRAALLNLKGMLSQEQGDKVAAKKFYELALAQAADFTPAKDNLSKLK